MVTTHDLALTEFGGGEDSGITNVHFADRLVDGKMIFDYRMRPGVVQHSNALGAHAGDWIGGLVDPHGVPRGCKTHVRFTLDRTQ